MSAEYSWQRVTYITSKIHHFKQFLFFLYISFRYRVQTQKTNSSTNIGSSTVGKEGQINKIYSLSLISRDYFFFTLQFFLSHSNPLLLSLIHYQEKAVVLKILVYIFSAISSGKIASRALQVCHLFVCFKVLLQKLDTFKSQC